MHVYLVFVLRTCNLATPVQLPNINHLCLLDLQISSTMPSRRIEWPPVNFNGNLPEEGVVPTTDWARTLQNIHREGGLLYPCPLQAPSITPAEQVALIRERVSFQGNTFTTSPPHCTTATSWRGDPALMLGERPALPPLEGDSLLQPSGQNVLGGIWRHFPHHELRRYGPTTAHYTTSRHPRTLHSPHSSNHCTGVHLYGTNTWGLCSIPESGLCEVHGPIASQLNQAYHAWQETPLLVPGYFGGEARADEMKACVELGLRWTHSLMLYGGTMDAGHLGWITATLLPRMPRILSAILSPCISDLLERGENRKVADWAENQCGWSPLLTLLLGVPSAFQKMLRNSGDMFSNRLEKVVCQDASRCIEFTYSTQDIFLPIYSFLSDHGLAVDIDIVYGISQLRESRRHRNRQAGQG